MGYIQKEWVNPTNVDATELNRIEKGIKDSHETLAILSEELANLQLKHLDSKKEIESLLKNSPNILQILTDIKTLVSNNSSLIDTLKDTSNLITKEQLDKLSKSFLHITSIEQDGNNIYSNGKVTITTPTVDTLLNKASSNAISNKAVTIALENLTSKIKIPTKLSELKEDYHHKLITEDERTLWNTIKNISLTEEDPTVPGWAKQPDKPTYEWNEILNTPLIPKNIADFPDASSYAKAIHDHDTKYSLLKHEHDNRYSPLSHIHSDYSLTSHDHDNRYSLIGHTHYFDTSKIESDLLQEIITRRDQYNDLLSRLSSVSMDYNSLSNTPDLSLYVLKSEHSNHDHSDKYASLLHNHDELYSKVLHDHNEVYSNINHNHDTQYSQLTHTHTEFKNIVNEKTIDLKIDTKVSSAIDELINGADGTYDTLKELQTAIESNDTLIDALTQAVQNHEHDSKYAPKTHEHDIRYYTKTESDNLLKAKAESNHSHTLDMFGVTATASEINKLDGLTATTTELNYIDGVTSNIQTQLDSKKYWANVTISDSSNDNTIPIFNPTFKIKVGANSVLQSQPNYVLSSPIGKYSWHDIFAFNTNGIPTVEVSADGGTTWSASTNKNYTHGLFIQKENQTIQIINDTQTAIRWSWYSTQFHACQAKYLNVGFAYSTPQANVDITFETSTDNITWTTGFEVKNVKYVQTPYWFYLTSGWSKEYYVRFTIKRVSTTGKMALSGIKLLTYRWGDQGKGSEEEKPYAWDLDQNIYPRATNTSSLGTSSRYWKTIYGTTIYENGSTLANKYAPISHTHSDYSLTSHNHDLVYSKLSHNHDGTYSLVDHNHANDYSAIGHNHDEDYAEKSHNHDSVYAKTSHTHTVSNITDLSTELNKYALTTHNHDLKYSALSHTHTESEISDLKSYLTKTTYEYNKEFIINSSSLYGSSSKVCIGKFPCYDTNITIKVASTTNKTHNGTIAIATQNIARTNSAGTLSAVVYGDANNNLASKIYIKRPEGYQTADNLVEVYYDAPPWSKNLIHIQCVALVSTPSYICEYVQSVPGTATIQPVNDIRSYAEATYSKLAHTHTKSEITDFTHTHEYLPLTGGNLSGHVYLTGAQANSSTGNTSQLVFGTSSNNHLAVTSNTGALVLNPSTTSTTGQMVLYTGTGTSKIPGSLTVGYTATANNINVNASGTITFGGTSNATGAKLKWGTVNSKNPYIGYATDQVDGTFLLGSLLGTNYASGLAIGGGSGNLLWKGNKVAITSDIPTDYAKKAEGVYLVDGTGNTTAGTWEGTNSRIASYYDGLTVNFKIGVAGANPTTLNINGLGAKTCYMRGTSKITTHYAVGTMVLLTYNATTDAFYSSDYDANNAVTQTVRTTNGDFPLLLRGTSAGTSSTTTTTTFGTKMTANPSTGNISATSFTEGGYNLTRRYGTLAPFGTRIQASETNKTDLNQIAYLKVGNYYCSGNAEAKWLQNSPTQYAFMMQVLSPLSQTYDNETTGTWIYRLRKIQVYRGEEYVQQVYSDGTAGNFTYGPWKQTARTEDIPTGLPLGSIFAATVPILNDATVHLLDGSTISQSGMYAAFATYLKSLQSSYPNLFTTETTWQTIVSTNGECGKFVIDNTAGTIRLPKIVNFIQGTVSLSTIGDAVAPGIPNITGTFYYNTTANESSIAQDGAFTVGSHGDGQAVYGDDGTTWYYTFNAANGETRLDGTRSNKIYGMSDTVQPRSILYPYYIVLATAVKTQTVVDIDNIATDVNAKLAKADIKRYPVDSYYTESTWWVVYNDGWKEAGGTANRDTNKAYGITFTNEPTLVLTYKYNSSNNITGSDTPIKITTSTAKSNFTWGTYHAYTTVACYYACGY